MDNSRARNWIRVIAGGYIVYLGVQLIYAQIKGTEGLNAAFLLCGIVFIVCGGLFCYYGLKRIKAEAIEAKQAEAEEAAKAGDDPEEPENPEKIEDTESAEPADGKEEQSDGGEDEKDH